MNRETNLRRLKTENFDALVIGGGATGLGCALDAAARGYRTALVEADDFAKATSSRSTKLVHGGVRYLRQGNLALVREALQEREFMRANAPDLVRELRFLVPAYAPWDRAYYGMGLRFYDALAGKSSFQKSSGIPASRATDLLPNLRADRLRGATLYSDAQFDDARFAIALARTAVQRGAALANYVRATNLRYDAGVLCGVEALDAESGERFGIAAKSVINATGIFIDSIRAMDDPRASPLLTYSRGSHFVAGPAALGESETALLIPRTADGRVVFAIPWHGKTLVGTTDLPAPRPEYEPRAGAGEVAYLLETVNRYLSRQVRREDIRSVFTGLRPLVNKGRLQTARLSREHLIDVSEHGLVSVAGGKWTTYRRMAQDAVDAAERQAQFAHVASSTRALRLADETALASSLSGEDRILHAVRCEMARTVEDVLARRTRLLFLDARAASAAAPATAAALAHMLNRPAGWAQAQCRAFQALAAQMLSSAAGV